MYYFTERYIFFLHDNFCSRTKYKKKKMKTTLPIELIKLTSRREGSQSVYAIGNVILTIYIKHISRVSTTTINNKSFFSVVW